MMTAMVELDTLYITPPLDHGSSSPLLQSTTNTCSWTTVLRVCGEYQTHQCGSYYTLSYMPLLSAIFTINLYWAKQKCHPLCTPIKNI